MQQRQVQDRENQSPERYMVALPCHKEAQACRDARKGMLRQPDTAQAEQS